MRKSWIIAFGLLVFNPNSQTITCSDAFRGFAEMTLGTSLTKALRFRLAVRNPNRLDNFTRQELEEFLYYVFPGRIGAINPKNSDLHSSRRHQLQYAYARALQSYVKKYLYNGTADHAYVIKSYDDLLRFGLFEIKDGALVNKVHLQGNNLASMGFDYSDMIHPEGGLKPNGINGSTTYYRPAGNKYFSFDVLAYVGRSPYIYGSSEDYIYSELGILVALDPAKLEKITRHKERPGDLEGDISTYSDFLKAEPRVFLFDPEFRNSLRDIEGSRKLEKWISNH